ncbi:stage V sporulation protein B [Paenibacillus algorifonticola]|uniref:Stage V sporulation protein B n=1 Tax=Paenibacillus algorifonticola TaxID=684063 RepID=A0A1I2HQ74_9BACL|nr:polysaccharide biosynthesis protein [Paenibacillus algorifonticola]SFF30531.1 stage V sporulation protein B [Paenibacillus algorifonticola]
MKKDSLIKGTLILAMAALVARMLGIFQRVPLEHMLSKEGLASFTVSNNLYLTLLIVATGGIPSAISKMVSERYALGRQQEAQRIYKAALLFGLVTGLILATLLYVFAPQLAASQDLPDAVFAIRAIAPTLLLFPLIAMMRGYFQGRQLMMAGGLSQIMEQIMRVIVGVGLAILVLAWGWGDQMGAAAASFGNFFGAIGAIAVMVWYAVKLRRTDKLEMDKMPADSEAAKTIALQKAEASRIPFRTIYREIFSISIPIVVTAITVQLIYMVDNYLLMKLRAGVYSYDQAIEVLADFGGKAQSIAGIPPILAIALSTSIIPVISSAFSVRNMSEVNRQTSLVMRIVLFTGIPAALTLAVLAYSVTGLLFTGPQGSGIVAALTAGTIFQATMMISNSVLFGLGRPRLAMYNTLIGIGLKLLGSFVLAPIFGIYGLIAASTLCFIFITWFNLQSIRTYVQFNVLGRRWVPYFAAVLISMAAGWGVDKGLRWLLESFMLPDRLAYVISAIVAGAVIGGLYLGLLILLRVVTAEDVKTFPEPLRKLFAKLFRLTGRAVA